MNITGPQLIDLLTDLLKQKQMDPELLDKIGLDATLLEEAEAKVRPTVDANQMELTLRLPTPVALQVCHLFETGVLYGSLVANAGDVKRDPYKRDPRTK